MFAEGAVGGRGCQGCVVAEFRLFQAAKDRPQQQGRQLCSELSSGGGGAPTLEVLPCEEGTSWHFRTWSGALGGAGLMVGLGDLGALSQPKQFSATKPQPRPGLCQAVAPRGTLCLQHPGARAEGGAGGAPSARQHSPSPSLLRSCILLPCLKILQSLRVRT